MSIVAGLILSACAGDRFVPQAGDLLFEIGSDSSFSNAITDATAQDEELKFAHVAIVAADENGDLCVIEASGHGGVVCRSLDDFLMSAPKVNGCPGVVVKRVCAEFSVEETIARAREHLGEEYDWWYLPDNGRMYCSELVYECFRTPDGEPLFSASPMNFRAADGSIPEFWRKLFAELDAPIPEGVAGTNPNDMSNDPVLREVYRYF